MLFGFSLARKMALVEMAFFPRKFSAGVELEAILAFHS